jgi:long-subunit fatty acid transport protein
MKYWTKMVGLCFAGLCLAPTINATAADKPDDYKGVFNASFGSTGDSKLKLGNQPLGELNTRNYSADYVAILPCGDQWDLRAGVGWQRFQFDHAKEAPVPDYLQSVNLKLGATWKFKDKWALRADLSPGLYSDFKDFSWDDFNVPAMAAFTYTPKKELVWAFGLRVDVRNEYPVLPFIGVRWKFAEEWTLALMAPKLGLEFVPHDQWMFNAGIDFKGGSYRVARNFGNASGRPELNNQDVSYRELRAGVGAQYKINKTWKVTVDAGWAIDRRFKFEERDLQLRAGGAPFAQLGVTASY